ncbi:hypothetical protein BC938DRAFT_473758 [Jimgerdemannia flammicorona]|uniref:Uncharacterized protein n=1 Tax=Jimgerdemannia flammicorona TaxID=994334 RepID=A0A433QT60_9FUNG|nr:hypothetical protein BC938DRAFT_473758 [Jimgerdemannia flammicorona]
MCDPSIIHFWNTQDELKLIKMMTTNGVLSTIKATNEIHYHNLQFFLWSPCSDVKLLLCELLI